MKRPPRINRRSFILIAVLVVVGSSLLVATGLLFVAQTEMAVSVGAGETLQARALAMSGVQAAMSQLASQRERILAGKTPEFRERLVIYENGNRQGIAQLLSVSGVVGEPLAIAEAGKIDLNLVDAGVLGATGRMSPEIAQAVADHVRTCGGRVQSVHELMRVPGGVITAEMLGGPLAEQTVFGSSGSPSSSPTLEPGEPCVRGFGDVLTVFTIEPLLQKDGTPRINLNAPWSEDMATRLEQRFGSDAAARFKAAFDQGVKFDSDAALVRALRQANVPVEDWAVVLDACCTQKGAARTGRLDINSAPLESLLALPGLSADQAAQMVRTRSSLDERDRAAITWPALQQIVTTEQFEVMVDRITTRSWTWRMRIAGGEVRSDEPNQWLSHPIVYEVVLDVSDAKLPPRIAYLRDITVLEETLAIAAAAVGGSTAGLNAQDELVEGDSDSVREQPPVTNAELAQTAAQPAAAPGDRVGRWSGR